MNKSELYLQEDLPFETYRGENSAVVVDRVFLNWSQLVVMAIAVSKY